MQLKVKVEHWCTDNSVWYMYEIAHILKANIGLRSQGGLKIWLGYETLYATVKMDNEWRPLSSRNPEQCQRYSWVQLHCSTARLWEIEGLVWAALCLP